MKTVTDFYPIYDLSNHHFQNTEITLNDNKKIKGQFVEFKVIKDINGYKIYPSEKLCFLPIENKKEFWDTYKINNGKFNKLPEYINEIGLNEIKKIITKPQLIV
jgi:hypothetical protein